jgi:hypothetical protein
VTILDPASVKAGGASLLLRNLTTALDATPDNQTLTQGAREIAEAFAADAGHLHGNRLFRLGNEVMLEASDI